MNLEVASIKDCNIIVENINDLYKKSEVGIFKKEIESGKPVMELMISLVK